MGVFFAQCFKIIGYVDRPARFYAFVCGSLYLVGEFKKMLLADKRAMN